MFFGKFIGRFLVLAVAIVVTFIAVSGLSAATYGDIPLSEFGPLLLFSLLLGAIWTSIVVSLSALSASRTRVIAACISIWLLFVVLWEILLSVIHLLIEGTFPEAMGPDLVAEPTWLLVLQQLNPVEAFAIVSSEYVGPTILPALFTFITGAQRGEYTIAERYHGQEGATEVPFFLEGEFAHIILIAWILIPLAIGYLRFRSIDL